MKDGSCRLKNHALPSQGGIYAFWWTGPIEKFINDEVNRNFVFMGPGGKEVVIEVTDKWIKDILIEGRIPLYVGKTANSLHKRMSLHLQLKSKRILSQGNTAVNEKKKSTTNQIRHGIERMFINEPDTRTLILENIGLSYVILNGDDESVNRFYLEDKAIGELLPIFNVDVER